MDLVISSFKRFRKRFAVDLREYYGQSRKCPNVRFPTVSIVFSVLCAAMRARIHKDFPLTESLPFQGKWTLENSYISEQQHSREKISAHKLKRRAARKSVPWSEAAVYMLEPSRLDTNKNKFQVLSLPYMHKNRRHSHDPSSSKTYHIGRLLVPRN